MIMLADVLRGRFLLHILLIWLFCILFSFVLLNLFSSKLFPLILPIFIMCLSLRITVFLVLFDLFSAILQVEPRR